MPSCVYRTSRCLMHECMAALIWCRRNSPATGGCSCFDNITHPPFHFPSNVNRSHSYQVNRCHVATSVWCGSLRGLDERRALLCQLFYSVSSRRSYLQKWSKSTGFDKCARWDCISLRLNAASIQWFEPLLVRTGRHEAGQPDKTPDRGL